MKVSNVSCWQDLKARNTPGYAVGGLAGGEDKESFCRRAMLAHAAVKRVFCSCGNTAAVYCSSSLQGV